VIRKRTDDEPMRITAGACSLRRRFASSADGTAGVGTPNLPESGPVSVTTERAIVGGLGVFDGSLDLRLRQGTGVTTPIG